MIEFSFIPLFTWLVSLLAVPAILLFRKRPDAREGITFLAAFLKLGMILMMLPLIREGCGGDGGGLATEDSSSECQNGFIVAGSLMPRTV